MSEDLFKQVSLNNGYKVIRHASSDEDMFEHWDWLCEKDSKLLKIEVKGKKHLWRNGPELLDSICVEWRNVRGNNGWIYGKSDLIAFHVDRLFLIFNREELLKSCEKLVNFNKEVKSFKDSYNCIYTRPNRDDRMSLIKLSDVCKPLEVLKV